MKAGRPARHSHAPGTFWYYNNWDFNALGGIYRQQTGGDIYRDFADKIAKPLGMRDFDPTSLAYSYRDPGQAKPASIHPSYPFRMSARDLARFGLMYLRQGQWRGEQILPPGWVTESTAPHSEAGPKRGYGYMWWTGEADGPFGTVRVPGRIFYAAGYRGHYLIVMPDLRLVVAHRVDTDRPGTSVSGQDMGRLLWLILDAAGCADIGEPPVMTSAPGQRLTPEVWRGFFAGGRKAVRTLVKGGEYSITYLADGAMELSRSGDGRALRRGRWRFEGDRFLRELAGRERAWADLSGCVPRG